jgi:hypothetical protein
MALKGFPPTGYQVLDYDLMCKNDSNQDLVSIEVGLHGHLRCLRGHFLLILYWYNKTLYQEKELNTRYRWQKLIFLM